MRNKKCIKIYYYCYYYSTVNAQTSIRVLSLNATSYLRCCICCCQHKSSKHLRVPNKGINTTKKYARLFLKKKKTLQDCTFHISFIHIISVNINNKWQCCHKLCVSWAESLDFLGRWWKALTLLFWRNFIPQPPLYNYYWLLSLLL